MTKLQLDPAFADYLGEAFKPLGVYINFFQPTLAAGKTHPFTIMLVNDQAELQSGEVTLSLEGKSGKVLVRSQQPFTLSANGAATLNIPLDIPGKSGGCVLKAVARVNGQSAQAATLCRRWLSVVD